MSLNVTIDDFDPLIAYGDYAAWSTPDPSQNPTFWNVSTEVSGVPWHQGGYRAHRVRVDELMETF
jgi:hypothetical protein